MYSVRIVTNLNATMPPENKILANTFTQIIGISTWVAAVCSFFVVRFVKLRKQLMMWGVLLVSLSLVLCALSMQLQNGYAAVLFAVAFELSYGMTMGPVHWIYVPEILADMQFGVVTTLHYLNGVEMALTTEFMVDSWGPAGTFFFYGLINFAGFFFIMAFVKETHGLTDKQKKQLYMAEEHKEKENEQLELPVVLEDGAKVIDLAEAGFRSARCMSPPFKMASELKNNYKEVE